MSRIIVHSAARQAPLRARLAHRRPVILRAPVAAPPVVVPVAFALVKTVDGWHLPADHHDPVQIATEGAVVLLLLVVVIVGFSTMVRVVRREIA